MVLEMEVLKKYGREVNHRPREMESWGFVLNMLTFRCP
jgi:hypothetical protein